MKLGTLPGARVILRRRRDRALVAALPEALERLAAELRSGGSVLGGLRDWAAGSGPLALDAGQVVARLEAGSTLEASLAAWRRERALPAVGVTAGVLGVAVAVGGRSAAALEGLAGSLRDESGVREEVSAQSAQARLSALVVGLAPLASVGLSALFDRRVPAALLQTGPGRACLVAGVSLEFVAALWMGRMLRMPT